MRRVTPRSHLGMAYRPDIDGMRAVAVAGVVAFHASPALAPGGFSGVDIFFAISGYLISRLIIDALDGGRFRFGDFYARRLVRLAPALAVVLAVIVALLSLSWSNALFAALLAGLSGFGMAWLALRQIGGQTGDVLGGAEQVAETAILVLLAARLA